MNNSHSKEVTMKHDLDALFRQIESLEADKARLEDEVDRLRHATGTAREGDLAEALGNLSREANLCCLFDKNPPDDDFRAALDDARRVLGQTPSTK